MPILPLVILYFIAEVFAINKVWNSYGFVNTAFALFAAVVLGTGIIRNQGRYILAKVQAAAAKGEPPSDQLLHGMMVFFGGLLFIAPGFISDGFGLLLVLPGTRHLLIAIFKRRMAKQMNSGQFKVFTFGNFGAGGFSGGFSTGGFPPPDMNRPQTMRDVSPLSLEGEGEIIDVTPIKKDPPSD